eukprot:Hpha_TRINITY_DN15152_c3_g15::TRINITY_DN15152_c3_g15_i1::g.127286::m.127286
MPSPRASPLTAAVIPGERRGSGVPVVKPGWGGQHGSPHHPSGDPGLSDSGGGVLSEPMLDSTVPTDLGLHRSTSGGESISQRGPSILPGSPKRLQSTAEQPRRGSLGLLENRAIGASSPSVAAPPSRQSPFERPLGGAQLQRDPSKEGFNLQRQGSKASAHSSQLGAAGAAAPVRKTSETSGSVRSGKSGRLSARSGASGAPLGHTTPQIPQVGPPRGASGPQLGGAVAGTAESRWDPELAKADWQPGEAAAPSTEGLSGPENILVKRIEYIPVHVARQQVKELCAEMARTRHEHLAAIERVEAHYAQMKAAAERRVGEYVEALAAQHRREVTRLRDDHAVRTKKIRSELLGRVEEEVDLARERASRMEEEAQDKISEMDLAAERTRRKEEAKLQGALRLLREEQSNVRENIGRMKEEARREAVEALEAKAEIEREFRATEEARRKEISDLNEERRNLSAHWDEEKGKLQDTIATVRAEAKAATEAGESGAMTAVGKMAEGGLGRLSALESVGRETTLEFFEAQVRALLANFRDYSAASVATEDTLKTQLKSATDSGSDEQKKAAGLEAKVAELDKKLTQSTGECEKLRESLSQESSALAALKTAVSEKDSTFAAASTELEGVKKEHVKAKEERDFLKESLDREQQVAAKAKRDLDVRGKELQRLQTELDACRGELDMRVKEQQREFERAQEERRLQMKAIELQRDQREREKRVKSEPPAEGARPVTRGATRLKDKEGELHDDKASHRKDLESVVADVDTRIAQANKSEEKLRESSAKREAAATKLQSAQQDRVAVELRLVEAMAAEEGVEDGEELRRLQRQLQDAEDQLRRVRQEAEAREDERIEMLQQSRLRVAEMEAALAGEEERSQKHQDLLREKERALIKARRAEEDVRSQLAEARGQGEEGAEAAKQLQKQLEQREAEVERIHDENDELQERAVELHEEQVMLRIKLEGELAQKELNAHSARRTLEREIADMAAKLSAAEKTRARMREVFEKAGTKGSGVEELRRELTAQDQAVNRAQNEIDVVEKQRRALAAQQEEAEQLKAQRAELMAKIRDLEKTEQGGSDPQLKKKYDELLEVKKQLVRDLKDAREEAQRAVAAASEEKLRKEVEKAVAKKTAEMQKIIEELQQEIEVLRAKLKEKEEVGTQLKELKEKLENAEQELDDMKKMAGGTAELKKECAELRKTTKEALKRVTELEELYRKEVIQRKKLFNEVQDLKGKIRVMVRCRPMNRIENEKKSQTVVEFPDEYQINVQTKHKMKEYLFDFSFPPSSTQEDLWDESKHFCQSAIDGYNTCIFAYGQTGSGKTHTMEGSPDMPGLTPRCINEVYEIVEGMTSQYDYSVSCYMLELYTDNLHDLLLTPEQKKSAPHLDIKKDSKGMVFVQGATVRPCPTRESLAITYTEGCRSRHVRATGMNAASSRSHLVFGIMIETQHRSTGKVTSGKMSLVDLAGSERMDKTGIKDAQGQKEAMSINKSLTALGDVIRALSTDPGGFIPYRNNKLTLMMSDSLGGNAKTMMIAAISPASYNVDESNNTLVYASSAKNITNDAQKAQESKEVARLRGIIAKLRKGESVEAGEEH